MFWAIVIAVIAIVAVLYVFKNGYRPPPVVFLLLLPLSLQAGKLEDKLPPLEGLVRYGCAVKGPILQIDHNNPSGRKRPVWSVDFHADHKDMFSGKVRRDWKLLYAFRKKRRKGLDDCEKFMERVSRAIAKRDWLAKKKAVRNPKK